MWGRLSGCARAAGRAACRAALAGTLLLAACETAPGPETAATPDAAAPPTAAPGPVIAAVPARTPDAVLPAAPPATLDAPDAASGVAPAADAVLAARTGPAMPTIDADPQRLLNMDSAALADLLGRPVFIRKDAPAQIWRYRQGNCLLDVFLYDTEDELGRRLAVRHVAARTSENSAIPADQCLREILLARMRGLSG